MSCLRESVVVVRGEDMGSWRSVMDAAKRIIRCISCSGSAAVVAMVDLEVGEGVMRSFFGGVRSFSLRKLLEDSYFTQENHCTKLQISLQGTRRITEATMVFGVVPIRKTSWWFCGYTWRCCTSSAIYMCGPRVGRDDIIENFPTSFLDILISVVNQFKHDHHSHRSIRVQGRLRP